MFNLWHFTGIHDHVELQHGGPEPSAKELCHMEGQPQGLEHMDTGLTAGQVNTWRC